MTPCPTVRSLWPRSRIAASWRALAVAVLAGLVRGFSGFGSALIYMPLVAAVYDPRVAAVTLLLIDTVGAAPFAVRAVDQCTWREVLPI